jgi:myo-inositol-1(or 4)-monophosphatase
LDGFWEFWLNPWDIAAGMLLIEEAGGRTSDMKGNPAELRAEDLLASNGHLHGQVLELFAGIRAGHYRFPLPVISQS